MDLTKEEKRFFQLCDKGTAPISEFRALIDRGVRLNIHDEEGWHPLWHVSYAGRSDLADLFLQHGAEVDLACTDKDGQRALIIASQEGHLETVKLLLHRGALVNSQRKDGNTALCFSSKNNHVEIVKLLLNSGAQVNKGSSTPLYVASLKGRLEITQVLLDHGADVNQPCDVEPRPSPLEAGCQNNHLQVAQLLISKGADVDYQDSNGHTPLHAAAFRGHIELVKLLLLSHAKLNIKDNSGYTPLHWAISSGHIEVVRLLLLSQANMEIKNNAGKTPLQLAEEKKHMEIVHLLKTGVPAQPAEVSMSGDSEAGDGEKPGEEEEPSVEPLTGELKSTDDCSQLAELPKEDYVCVARNSLCLVYLPQQINEKLSIETVTDERLYPRIASNEIIITPVVRITPDNASLALEKPVIIELAKTIELSEKEGDNKVIPLYTKSNYSGWNQLGTGSVVNCRVLQDRISFQVTHFSLYAVISRKPYPTSSVRVKPASATAPPTPDHSSNTHTQLIIDIPELPGFKVQIPPSSVNADRETNITATILYDSPAVCSEDERSRLASSCIELEPHGITFTKKVSVSLPIPDYAEVMKNDPEAELQVWHSNERIADAGDREERIELVKHYICQDEAGRYIAVVEIDHFSGLKAVWKSPKAVWRSTKAHFKKLFQHTFNIKERCQVFMSQETRLSPSQDITFSVAVIFYPYKEEPESLPPNYKYMLLDSGLLDLGVVNDNAVQYEVKLNEQLLPKKHKSIAGSLVVSGRQQKSFTVELDGRAELKGNFPMGELSIGVREHNYHTLTLIKPAAGDEVSESAAEFQSAALPSSPTAYQFEESIVTIEIAAEKLDEEASRYDKENPGAMVEAAKKIASIWTEMAELLRKECVLKERRVKEDIVALAKSINKESQEVARIARKTAEACTDKTMKSAVNRAVERTQTISHQLRILAAGAASRQRDEASDMEACQLLTENAKNLTSAISDALYHTQCASIKVAMATREELGLTQLNNIEAISITGEPSHTVKDDKSREGDHYQDSHDDERSRGHSTPGGSSSRAEKQNCLSPNDLERVQNRIWEARVQWYNLGLGLHITPDSLDTIELANTGKPDRCFRAMLIQWLRDSHQTTWSALAEALRSPSVGLSHLAQEILEQN